MGVGATSSAPRDRLFFAVVPDADTAVRIAALTLALKRSEDLSGKPIKAEQLHVTLIHVGDWDRLPKGVVDDCRRIGETTATGPFEVAFDRSESFSSEAASRPFVLLGDGEGTAAMTRFRADLSDRLVRVGIKPTSSREFTPHLTLLYDPKIAAARPVDPVRWTVGELLLIHSEIGRNKYHELGRWPLEARP